MKILFSLMVIFSSVQFSFAGEGGISVTSPWARPVILDNRPGAAYFIIHNTTARPDNLIGASSPLAERIELHIHKHEDGVMRMERVENIPVASHGMTAVKPGGYHLMMFGLKKRLAVGDELPLTLTFANAGEINIMAGVMKKSPKTDHGKMKH